MGLSLVIPVFNAAATLEATLRSCLAQRGVALELIVVDGGSTDGSVEIVRRHADRLAWWVSERDGGIYDAWNKGLARATQPWIAFFGADDTWAHPEAAARLMALARHPEVNLVTARLRKTAHNGVPARVFGEPWSMRRMRMFMGVAHAGMPHHRSLFDRHGAFDTRFRIAGDYDFLLRAGPDIRAAYLDEVVAEMGGAGVSSTQLSRVRDESVRALAVAPSAGRFWAGVFWLRFVLRHGPRLLTLSRMDARR
jgi:glycosyltransferase involved in cell wall biosynthesis